MLESSLLSTPEFVEFSKTVVLFLHNTSRVDDEPYPKLLSEKGFGGFPSICFMNGSGEVTVRNLQRKIESLTRTRTQLDELQKLRKGAGKGDKKLERQLFLLELDLQMLTAEQARERMKTVELDDADKTRVEQFLVDGEVRALRGKARELGADAVGEKCAAMAHAGRLPSAEMAQYFWQMILSWSAKSGDVELAERAFEQLESDKTPAVMRERNRAMLEQARASGKK